MIDVIRLMPNPTLVPRPVPVARPTAAPNQVKHTKKSERETSALFQTKSQAEIDEEESLQLALAISQSEAEEKERQKKLLTQKYAMSSFISQPTPPMTTAYPSVREKAELEGKHLSICFFK